MEMIEPLLTGSSVGLKNVSSVLKNLHGNHAKNVGPGKPNCQTETKLCQNGERGGELKIYT